MVMYCIVILKLLHSECVERKKNVNVLFIVVLFFFVWGCLNNNNKNSIIYSCLTLLLLIVFHCIFRLKFNVSISLADFRVIKASLGELRRKYRNLAEIRTCILYFRILL